MSAIVFQPAYAARLMASLPGQDPVEWVRSHRAFMPHELAFWQRDVDPAWTVWVETTLWQRRKLSSLKYGKQHTCKKVRWSPKQEAA